MWCAQTDSAKISLPGELDVHRNERGVCTVLCFSTVCETLLLIAHLHSS